MTNTDSLWPDALPEALRDYLIRVYRSANGEEHPPYNYTDSSGHSGAKTYRIEARVDTLVKQQAPAYYLKIWDRGRLAADAERLDYFSRRGLAPKPVLYIAEGELDYLLTEAVEGIPATDPELLRDPSRLARALGTILRSFHDRLDLMDCPYRAPEEPSFEADTVIHGDYCLPNVLLDKNYRFLAFLDLNAAGYGDLHHDLYWGLWSLEYNLGTTAYGDRFLDAYGRDRIDPTRLRLVARQHENEALPSKYEL